MLFLTPSSTTYDLSVLLCSVLFCPIIYSSYHLRTNYSPAALLLSICNVPWLPFQYGLARYKVVDTPKTGEFSPKVIVIVCQNCLDMYDRCLSRGSDYNTFSDYFTDIMDNSPELSFIESKKIDVIADSELTAVDAASVSSRSHPAVCKGVIKRLAESVMPIITDTAVSRSHPNKDNILDKIEDEYTAAIIDPIMSCSTAFDTTVRTADITSDVLVTTAETDHVPILPTRTDSDNNEALDVGAVTAHVRYKAATLSEHKKKGRKPKLRLCEVAVKDTLQDYCSAAPNNVDVTDSREHDSSIGVDVMDILEAEVPGMGTGIGIPHDSEPPTASCTISQATYYSNSTATRGAVVSLVNDRRIWKGSAVTCKASEAQKKKQKIFNPNTAGSFAKTRPTLN